MSSLVSHVLPALESFGIWSYWIIGAFSLLEGWWITGIVVPGTLVVEAGGALVRLGQLDFLDLVWFVAIGAILGGEAGWHTGRWLGGRIRFPQSRAFVRAQDLVRRRGPLALVLGRFLGPVAGLAALAAALSGMERRRFVLWNIISGFVYALSHVALGYIAGDVLARLAPYLPRIMLPLGLLLAVILITWLITRGMMRGAPVLRAILSTLRNRLVAWPPVVRFAEARPRLARLIARRFDPGQGGGLMATAGVALLIYLLGVFADGALDLALVPGTVELDQRVANLAHAYWTPGALTLAGWFTQAGHVPVATLVALGCTLGFAGFGRRAAAIGFATAVVGNAITVTLLKLAFGRARPDLSYFLETSHSFPSGHAAISVALYGTLALMLLRERLIGPTTALVAGVGMAFGLGLTRIFLVEHFLSDVLNGWVIGAIWMVIGLGLAEAVRHRHCARPAALRWIGVLLMLACFGGAGWFALYHTKSPAEQSVTAPMRITDLDAGLRAREVPLGVVTLSGEELAPISVITQGLSLADLQTRLIAEGWSRVPVPGITSVFAALEADLTDERRQDATAPLAFRATRPAESTLRNAATGTLLRVWLIGTDASGAPIFGLAIAAQDSGTALARTSVVEQLGRAIGGTAREVRLLAADKDAPRGTGSEQGQTVLILSAGG